MNRNQLQKIDLNLLVIFDVLMQETSVKATAERMHKTPSAISHALSRLRLQLNDPILVKVNGAMTPSPYAVEIMPEVRACLSSIERLMGASDPFDPLTSRRKFRVSVFGIPDLITELIDWVAARAPHISLEFLPYTRSVCQDLLDERIDIALVSSELPMQPGLGNMALTPLKRYVLARSGHPTTGNWNRDSWQRWPHLLVDLGDMERSRLEACNASRALSCKVGASVSGYAAVGAILAGSDMIAYQHPTLLLHDIMQHDLQIMEAPVTLPDLNLRFCWNRRLEAAPCNTWIRQGCAQAFANLQKRADDWVARTRFIPLQDRACPGPCDHDEVVRAFAASR